MTARRPPVRGPWVYTYRVDPDGWAVVEEGLDGPTWVPLLAIRVLPAGADRDALQARDARHGVHWVPGERGYTQAVASQNGPCVLSTFDTLERLERGRVRITTDRAAINRWRVELVEAGVIATPKASELRRRNRKAARPKRRRRAHVES